MKPKTARRIISRNKWRWQAKEQKKSVYKLWRKCWRVITKDARTNPASRKFMNAMLKHRKV